MLNTPERKVAVIDAIERASARLKYRVIAFVIMHNHVHFIASPRALDYSIADLLFAIKRPVSYRFKQEMRTSGDPMLETLTIRQRPGKQSFRFWQEGPGYDRNIHSFNVLASEIAYVHQNPVRKGFCAEPEDWTWSTARRYAERRRNREMRSREL